MRVGVIEKYWPDCYKNDLINHKTDYEDLYLQIHLFKSYKCLEKVFNVTTIFLETSNKDSINNYIKKFRLD